MNTLDMVLLSMIIIAGIIGYFKGIITMALSTCGGLIAFFLSQGFYPIIARIITALGFYDKIFASIQKPLSHMVVEQTKQSGMAAIDALSVPTFMKDLLIEHNNTAIYEKLGVFSVVDYMAGFLSVMVINLLAAFIAFLIFSIILSMASQMLGFLGKLPIIRSFNKGGGLILGLLIGTCLVWFSYSFLGLYWSVTGTNEANLLLFNSSLVGKFFSDIQPYLALLLK